MSLTSYFVLQTVYQSYIIALGEVNKSTSFVEFFFFLHFNVDNDSNITDIGFSYSTFLLMFLMIFFLSKW